MKKLIVLLIFGMLFTTSELRACSCIGERSVKEEIKASDAVFVGKIVSKELVEIVDSTILQLYGNDTTAISRHSYTTLLAKYELVLTARYKGKITNDTLEIYTGLGGGDCGIRFEIGQEYIVYGEREPYLGQSDSEWQYPTGNNVFWTQTCTRTMLVNDEELRQIGKFRRKRVTL